MGAQAAEDLVPDRAEEDFEVVWRDPKDLVPHPLNIRHHPEAQVQEICERLTTLGQYKTVTLGGYKGQEVILTGHGVCEGVLKLGWPRVACRLFEGSDNDGVKLMLGDNEVGNPLSEVGPRDDEAALLALADEVQAAYGSLAGTGISEADLKRRREELEAETAAQERAELEDPGAGEPPPEPQTKLGDVWVLGEHRVVCGDCTEPTTWEKLCKPGQVNVVFTSPPYAEQRKEQYGGVPPDEYIPWFEQVATNAWAWLAEDGSFFVNLKEHCEDGERHLYVKKLVVYLREQCGWKFVDEFCWLRRSYPGAYSGRFKNAWEPVFHFAKANGWKHSPKAVLQDFKSDPAKMKTYAENPHIATASGSPFEVGGKKSYEADGAWPDNVLEAMHIPGECLHPASFPVGLPEWFARAFSESGDAIADPFLGSGTTLIAAEKLGRRAYGIELEPRYVDVTCRRWAQMTGQTPTLEGAGRPFALD